MKSNLQKLIKKKLGLFILFLLPLVSFAQSVLQGSVINEVDGKPLPDASVFLNNTTLGSKTNAEGKFRISCIPSGQYELIVSLIGFKSYNQVVTIDRNTEINGVKMTPTVTLMNEVTVSGSDKYRSRKLRMFKEQFLGASGFSNDCEISNPEILVLKFQNHQQVLTGYSNDFLEIENKATGYKIKYLLNNFKLDKIALNISYEGYAFFEELKGDPKQKELWEKHRRAIYYGSPTHFLRVVTAGKADSDFVVRPFCIKKIDTLDNPVYKSMLDIRLGNSAKYYMLRYDTLTTSKYVHPTSNRGVYAISYPYDLDVFYFPPGVPHSLDAYHEHGNRGQIGSFDFINSNIFFDYNGRILNPDGVSLRYRWGRDRVAELLPLGYNPPLREQTAKR
ncbi:carboxypeptidase-like regulatory domain-containing protein [Mucilaginibacter sp. 21P]|uniref:carboxypeptidase-like regulatory domain-containing protein n=1 Tax=Mucilaginibacter sp. 21P TaxID=2778902 RepID=UPI001C56B6D9|nr:carboxypeptidase-like regulatory domain-containing protein [Mucilaginibacter sp. 21P]QXV65526.1 carboxypeptidase-like regulatory domain-containing protein [Mucilaginibacter sp. 21P]